MTATETPTAVQAVKEAIRRFELTQDKYRDYGARDTEPDAIFQGIVWRTCNGKDANIPQTGSDWELYAGSMDCAEAASALHLACLGVVQAIFACTVRDSKELRKYLTDYCWRYN